MKIDVEYIADLAQLPLSEEEKKQYQKQLENIVEFVEGINELDTENVKPTYQVPYKENVLREDVSKEGLSSAESTKNASETDGSFIVTKGVFSDE